MKCQQSTEEIDSRLKKIKKYADILHTHYYTLLMLVVDDHNTHGSPKHSSTSDAIVMLSLLLNSLTSLSDHCIEVINEIPGIRSSVFDMDVPTRMSFWKIKDSLKE